MAYVGSAGVEDPSLDEAVAVADVEASTVGTIVVGAVGVAASEAVLL